MSDNDYIEVGTTAEHNVVIHLDDQAIVFSVEQARAFAKTLYEKANAAAANKLVEQDYVDPMVRDDDIPIDVRNELLACAITKQISYGWLCDIYRKGWRAQYDGEARRAAHHDDPSRA